MLVQACSLTKIMNFFFLRGRRQRSVAEQAVKQTSIGYKMNVRIQVIISDFI